MNLVAPTDIIEDVEIDGEVIADACDHLTDPQVIPGTSGAWSWVKCRLPNPCEGGSPPASCPYGEEHTIECRRKSRSRSPCTASEALTLVLVSLCPAPMPILRASCFRSSEARR